MKDIITQSSCLFFRHPAIQIAGSGDYMRVIIRDRENDKEKIVFTGKKWDEDNFKKKQEQEAYLEETYGKTATA